MWAVKRSANILFLHVDDLKFAHSFELGAVGAGQL
jgi:hypothetical protein